MFIIIYILLIIFTNTTALAQSNLDLYTPKNTLRFADYLFNLNEYSRAASEYERYSFLSEDGADSIHFKIGLCYYYINKYDKSFEQWEKVEFLNRNSKICSEISFYTSYIYYKQHSYELSISEIIKNQKICLQSQNKDKSMLLLFANQLTLRDWTGAENILDNYIFNSQYSNNLNSFRNYLEEGKQIKSKNKIMALFFASVVPGSGKFYVGRKIDGFVSLFLLSLTTWQAYDGFSNDNVTSTKGWIFTGIGSVFYLGNIYGSAVAVNIYNEENKHVYNKKIELELHKAFNH